MNPLYLILFIFIKLFVTVSFSVDQKDSSQFDAISATGYTHTITNPCRPEVEMALEILERFISLSRHENKRSATGTTRLNISQVKLLNKEEDAEACNYFNSRHETAINAQRRENKDSPGFNVSYFKAGDFYFVVIVRSLPSDPNVVQTGASGLIIYDQHLNRIEGYSM